MVLEFFWLSLLLSWAAAHRPGVDPAVAVSVNGETFLIDDTTAIYMAKDKVIYCPIQKCASAEWLRVLLYLDSGDESRLFDGQGKALYPQYNSYDTISRMKMQNKKALWTAPDVVKFAVLRDPAERLLAVFRNKCYRITEDGEAVPRVVVISESKASGYLGACDIADSFPSFVPQGATLEDMQQDKVRWRYPMRVAFTMDPVGVFREYAENHLRAVAEKQCDVNDHFRPAHCSCGLAVLHKSYVKIPFHDMGSAVDKVFGDNYVGASPERKEYLREEVAKYFTTNTEVAIKITNTTMDAVRSYFTPELLDLARFAYRTDYALFGEYFYTSEQRWEGW